MTKKIALVAIEGCINTLTIGPIDLFAAANMVSGAEEPLFQWTVVSLDGQPVKTFNGLHQEVEQDWDSLGEVDLIMIPGIAVNTNEALLEVIDANRPLIDWLRVQGKKGTLIAGSCSGNFLLAEAGLLDGHPATTTWWFTDFLAERYPKIHVRPNAILTASDQFITSGTAMTCMDLSIYLIEKLAGKEIAKLTSRFMLVDVNRNSQAPYRLPIPSNKQDQFMTSASEYIQENLNNDISVQGLAKNMNVSPRTLIRRFTQQTGQTPLTYIQKQRLEKGKILLEESELSLEEIISQIGYQDSSSFRRLFKRQIGLSPHEYRKKFTPNSFS